MSGDRPNISVESMRRAIADIPTTGDDNFSICHFAPDSFLVRFSTQRARDGAMRDGSVLVGTTRLLFRPWTRLVRTASKTLNFRVSLEIEGLPAHAWGWRAARKVLASSCWIESLSPSSEDRSDMTTLALTAWTDRPSCIPTKKTVFIAEPETPIVHSDPATHRIFSSVRPYLREKKFLKYDVLIHLRSAADFSSRSPSPTPGGSPPSSDDDSGRDGNPELECRRFRGEGGPRLYGNAFALGTADDASAPPSCSRGAASHGKRCEEEVPAVAAPMVLEGGSPVPVATQSVAAVEIASPAPPAADLALPAAQPNPIMVGSIPLFEKAKAKVPVPEHVVPTLARRVTLVGHLW